MQCVTEREALSLSRMSVCTDGRSYLQRWLLTSVFVLVSLLPITSGCPKSCACYVPTEVHCTFRYLTAIPGQIQTAVERINLGYNSLTALRENDLSGLKHLELLMLHSNTIHSIADRAFQDLKSLQVLKMSYNRVKEINKDTFQGLEGLVRLHMDHNLIEFINPEAFYGLTMLQLVHLEGNLLQQLHPDTFITLRHSQVFKVSSVRNIHLSDNLLASLPKDVFTGCSQLENIYLHGNPWSCDCRMAWFPEWAEINSGVLKCKRDRKYARGEACPVCETPSPIRGRSLIQLPGDSFTCTKPWIHPHLKQRNVSLDEGDYTPVSPRDFIAPIGSLQMNLTDQFHNDASLTCTVQRPSAMENLTLTQVEEGEKNVTMLSTTISTWLVCNIDYEHIQQLWRILAMYSDVPMKLERGLMLSRTPDMIYKYTQIRPMEGHDEIHTDIEADIITSPAWLMQGEVNFQLDRTTTTFSTLHIKYRSVVNLRVENKVSQRKDRYSWTIIKRDNQTQTEHSVLIGGVVELNCQTLGEPKPSVEWILSDGSKVRAPYSSEDRRIVITVDGRLTLRGTDTSDTGLYRCIATNYLDADVLSFRVTVLSPDVEEEEVNGVKLSRPLGQSLVLDCGSAGNPEASVQWILPDHTVLDKSFGNRKLYRNGTLGIKDLTSRDRGFYRCLSANYLGVDLLTSQVTVTGEGYRKVTVVDREGSGVEAGVEFEVGGGIEEREDSQSEIPSSSPSDRTIKESRTITSDRPYPRLRSSSQGRGSGGSGGRRRGPASSRRIWSNRRVFDQASRKVDPQRFAEFMKKAQGGSTMKTEREKEKGVSETDMSADGDAGSGEGLSHEDGLVVLPTSVMTTTDTPDERKMSVTASRENVNNQNNVMATTDNSETSFMTTMEIPDDIRTSFTVTTENTDRVMTESYSRSDATPIESTFTHGPDITGSISGTQSEAVTPNIPSISRSSGTSGSNGESYALERNMTVPLRLPVTLRLTVTDTTDETQILFSGEAPAEAETSTGAARSLVADPNVTPMMDSPRSPPRGPEIHTATDPDSQTTFTAVTTTEREQDEITFHTTQRIKSPRLPAGSTIISRQQIHIIPPKNGRGGGGGGGGRGGGGRRRNHPGRRRFIKPNRITDIQSILNKLKQPTTVKKQGNNTVPYTMELTTDCDCDEDGKKKTSGQRVVTPKTLPKSSPKVPSSSLGRTERPISTTLDTPTTTYSTEAPTTTQPTSTDSQSGGEVSSDDMTSSEAPESDPTHHPMTSTTDEPTTSTITTTTASKVVRGKINWDRLFGNRARQKEKLNGLRKPARPSTTTEGSTTVQPTTTATTTTTALPTQRSLAEPVTESPSRAGKHRETPESSSDDDYGDSSPDSEASTTSQPGTSRGTTTPDWHYRYSNTTESSPDTQTIATPPTEKPAPREDTDEASSSGSESGGSGGYLSRRFGGNRRPNGGSGGRRPFRGRWTFRKTITTTEAPSTTTETTETIIETTVETTTYPTRTVSVSKPLYTPSRESERSAVTVSTDLTSVGETTTDSDSYEDENWTDELESTTNRPRAYTSTTRPRMTSNTPHPATTSRPYTTSSTHVQTNTDPIRVNTNIRLPSGRDRPYHITQRPMIRRTRPTVSSKRTRPSPDKTLTFDTLTVLEAEQGHTNGPYSSKDIDNAISNAYTHITGYDTTTASIVGFEPSTKDMLTKPRIVGGNAASFTVLSNSDAFLPCEAVGSPEPTISWKRFSSSTGSTMTIKGKMGKFEVFQNGTLSIQNANIKDRGQYLCLAENDQGSDKLLVTLSVVAYPSRILEPKVREIKSHSGKTVEMKCKVEGRPTPLVSWILANRTQVRGHNSDPRVSVTPEGTLLIKQVSVYDRGHYKCIASNPAGADTATVRLQVVAAPPGILEAKRQQVQAGVGQSLWLPCTAQGSPQPTVHWVLYDGMAVLPMKTSVDPRVSVFANGTLHLTDTAATDSGKYECIVTSSTGSERRVVTLMVEKKEMAPEIVEASHLRTVLSYGDQLRLNCSATGDPKPRIIWRLPSKAVVDQWHRMGNRIQVLDNGTLVIDSVSDKDTGDYLCVARSKVGDDLQLMKVTVSMKPAKIEPKTYSKKQVPYGNDLKVDCKASGAPEPEISWGLPDGTVVNSALQADSSSGGGRARRYILFDNGTLYLNQVGMAEEGDYTCYAENQLGKDEMHVHITVVTAAPRIRTPSRTYAQVKPGGDIRFDCEATGEPKPKILWMLPTNDMIAASNERYLMHVNGSLDIRDVKLRDAGEYVCMARNTAGDDSKVYKLDIDGNPPVINGYYQNRTVVKDTAAKYSRKFIDCKAAGDPPPKITWIMPDNIFLNAPYFGSRIIVHHNGTLEFRNVRPTDMAEFICMARNDGGEAVMVVQLEVTDMLQRPIFKNPFNEKVVTRMGKTTVLNCSADGHPTPEIIWLLPNGTRFTGSPDRGSRQHLGNDGTFVIYNPTKEDAGKYRCAAKNSVGYIEKLIVLEVGQKPLILTRPRGIIRSVSGDPLFLHCLADGSPRPSIYWTIPGGHTLVRPQVHGRHQLMENGTLVVKDTTLHDRGNYVCRAWNDAGEAVLTVQVIIIAYPPRITAGPPPTVRAVAGAPIQLNCAAIGIPKPEITWELPDRSVLSTAGKGRPTGSELLHPQGTLIIQRPTTADSGTYKCLAKNHLGTDSRVTYMRVL
ncbi:immunoglobulin superfamily member 10-like [Oncorhynchus clarkii lewisi]|uniref:immunoglobulin superfamily member 10-like n=1 Tax=Oncorhynchus clarkii lewisi TaxID=490388 RepID=UPI0039B8F6B8